VIHQFQLDPSDAQLDWTKIGSYSWDPGRQANSQSRPVFSASLLCNQHQEGWVDVDVDVEIISDEEVI
jgi:hypothetical protein